MTHTIPPLNAATSPASPSFTTQRHPSAPQKEYRVSPYKIFNKEILDRLFSDKELFLDEDRLKISYLSQQELICLASNHPKLGRHALVQNVRLNNENPLAEIDPATLESLITKNILLQEARNLLPQTSGQAPATLPTLPTYRMDLSDRFYSKETEDLRAFHGEKGYEFSYRVSDRHWLNASLKTDGGVLRFYVKSLHNLHETDGGGRDMFVSLMICIAKKGLKVKSISAEWFNYPAQGATSDNFIQYIENLSTMAPEDAAKATWTGTLAVESGFTKATIIQQADEPNMMEVLFEKP